VDSVKTAMFAKPISLIYDLKHEFAAALDDDLNMRRALRLVRFLSARLTLLSRATSSIKKMP